LSRRIRAASTVVAAAFVILRIALAGGQDRVIAWLAAHGRVQAAGVAPVFFSAFVKALMVSALFAAALAVAAALRQRRDVLAALVCAASALVCGSGQLVTAPRELLETRPPLAEMLTARAGPSAGSWRIESDTEQSLMLPGLDARLRRAAWSAQALAPRINAVHAIESASGYGSLNDEACLRAQAAVPAAVRAVLGVRFRVGMPWEQPPTADVLRGPYGMWIQEAKTLPRAFLVAKTRQSAQPAAALREAAFDPGAEAVTNDFALDEKGEPGDARLERPSPERMRIAVRAPGRRLLVVSEHFDPGWRATVDGAEAVVRRVDGCALGVEVPPGGHRVELGFVPRGLLPGAWAAGATLLALLALSARRCSTAAAR